MFSRLIKDIEETDVLICCHIYTQKIESEDQSYLVISFMVRVCAPMGLANLNIFIFENQFFLAIPCVRCNDKTFITPTNYCSYERAPVHSSFFRLLTFYVWKCHERDWLLHCMDISCKVYEPHNIPKVMCIVLCVGGGECNFVLLFNAKSLLF